MNNYDAFLDEFSDGNSTTVPLLRVLRKHLHMELISEELLGSESPPRDTAYLACQSIQIAHEAGFRKYSTWDEKVEYEKIKKIEQSLLSLQYAYINLHPKIRSFLNEEWHAELETSHENGFTSFIAKTKRAPDTQIAPLGWIIRELCLQLNGTTDGLRPKLYRSILDDARKKCQPDIFIKKEQSENKWRKFAVIDVVRDIWTEEYNCPAPISVNAGGTKFGFFLKDTFSALGMGVDPVGAMNQWSKERR